MERLRVERSGAELHLTGELDLAEVDVLRKVFASLVGAEVVDLSGLTFIDSSGLHELLELKTKHTGIRFVNPSERVVRIADIVGVSDFLFD